MLHLNLNIHLSRMTRMISSSLCQCGVTGGGSYKAHDPGRTGCMDEAAEFLEELNFDHSLILNLDGNQDCSIFFFRLNGICRCL